MISSVVHLITRINGVAALLFHVEHSPGSVWFWRWRIVGDWPAAYLAWREGEARGARQVFHPEVYGCVVEAQWRASEADEWSQAALREVVAGVATFLVTGRRMFSAFSWQAAAPLAELDCIAHYQFGEIALARGVETVVSGVAIGPHVDSVLLAEGEFRIETDEVRVVNTSATRDYLASPACAVARLEAVGGHLERMLFCSGAVKDPTPDPAP